MSGLTGSGGTLSLQLSADDGNTWVAASPPTITTNGVYLVTTAGYDRLQAVVTTPGTGSASISSYTSLAALPGGGSSLVIGTTAGTARDAAAAITGESAAAAAAAAAQNTANSAASAAAAAQNTANSAVSAAAAAQNAANSAATAAAAAQTAGNAAQTAATSAAAVAAAAQTVANAAAPADDPTNALGYGVGALLHGHLELTKASGLVFGAGQTTAVRQANWLRLQALLTAAASNGYELDLSSAATLETMGAVPLQVANGTVARWNGNANINEFGTNHGIINFGDMTGANYTTVDWTGGAFNFGVAQTGNTGSYCVGFGALDFSDLRNIGACPLEYATGPVNPGYYGILVGNPDFNGSAQWFQNHLERITIGGAQAWMLSINIGGTGSEWIDTYIHNGSNPTSAGALSGGCIQMTLGNNGSGSQNHTNESFIRLNCEHMQTGAPINIQNGWTVKIDGLHMEDIENHGGGGLINSTGAQLMIENGEILNWRSVAGALSATVFHVYYGGSLTVKHFAVRWDTSTPGWSVPGSFMVIGNAWLNGTDDAVAYDLQDISINDAANNAANFSLEPNIPVPLNVLTRFGHYQYAYQFPIVENAELWLTGNFTAYGYLRNPTFYEPSGVTTAFTLTMADTFKASGTGSTAHVPYGNTARVRTTGGSGAAITIKDAGGTTLDTLAANGNEDELQFQTTNAWAKMP